jgi:hypothetical protein
LQTTENAATIPETASEVRQMAKSKVSKSKKSKQAASEPSFEKKMKKAEETIARYLNTLRALAK